MKKVAVITDATSTGFFFPRWRRYYGRLFGLQNLHVVTYAEMQRPFLAAGIGNVWEVNSTYDDPLRAKIISDLITVLLHSHDVVLRCDVDEFLVPDLSQYSGLPDYIERNALPYVTANGIDIIEVADDPPLEPEVPIFAQRQNFLRSTSLNKTGLVTTPLRWASGFHSANVFPQFAGLFNFHLKFADLKGRITWHEQMMSRLTPGTSEYKYFAVGAEHLIKLQKFLGGKAKTGTETAEAFDSRFLRSVRYNKNHQIYQGDFFNQDYLFTSGDRFYAEMQIFESAGPARRR